VLAVLLFHLWPIRLPGGYIGVDIFFVISGFLITSHLLREVEATHRISLARFWARRARRLLPSSLLVLAATAIAVVVWVPRSLWPQFLGEVTASTLYVENWRLAADSVDYLAGGNQASPVQHFWTLSVEEQFYVALPLLLIGAVVLARGRNIRRAVLIAIVACTVAAFAYGVWYTTWSPSAAYFSTLTRAWEFGVGALIAFVPAMRGRPAAALTYMGMAAVLASALLFTSATPFPGSAALVPVLGTAAMIWGGRRTLLESAGRLRPVAFLGRVSYSAYLIHWPPIILLPFVTGHALTTAEKLGILALSVLAAWLCTTFVEDPVRFSPRLLGGRRPRAVAMWSAAGMALVLAVCGAASTVNAIDARAAAEVAASVVDDQPACFGAQSLDPSLSPCTNPDLAGMIVPAPAEAKQDDDNRSECWSGATESDFRLCALGPERGYARHLLAIGDSHNNTLIGVYESLAEAYNWRIDVAGHAGCYWTTADLRLDSPDATAACTAWRDAAREHIDRSPDLDAIVVTRSSAGKDADRETVEAMASAWSARPDQNTKVIALLDNPRLEADVVTCVEFDPPTSDDRCSRTRDAATFDDGQAGAAQLTPGATTIDLTNLYCTPEQCPPIVGGVLVYRDGNHLTATYASTIAPYLGRELHDLIE